MKGVSTAYFIDEKKWRKDNSNGENYFDIYIEEMLDEAGVKADAIYDFNNIDCYRYILIGTSDVSKEKEKLKAWVENGGILIGMNTDGADDLFGIKTEKTVPQADSFYTIMAHFKFDEKEDGTFIKIKDYNATLPIISKFKFIELCDNTLSIATMYNATVGGIFGWGSYGKCAMSERRIGNGICFYLPFGLPQTMWIMHKGRPVDRDWDSDGYYRIGDSIVLTPAHNFKIPHADIYMYMLTKLLSIVPQPIIHQLPPMDNKDVCDILIHFGGDDEGDKDYQINATLKMKQRGLPYHANLMLRDGKFAVDKEQFEQLKKDGCVPSIHFDFVAERTHFTEADVDAQMQKYVDAFGEIPNVSVNHVVMYTGWAEVPRWYSKWGIKGDNSKFNSILMPNFNPINTFGMAFGTSFPAFVYDDFEHENKKMRFTEIPSTLYEARVNNEQDEQNIEQALQIGLYYNQIFNAFFHPVYIDTDLSCLAAIDKITSYLKENNHNTLYMSNDAMNDWWFDRSDSTITDIIYDAGKCVFEIDCKYENGCIIKINSANLQYTVDKNEYVGKIRENAGEKYLMCYIPCGKHKVKINL